MSDALDLRLVDLGKCPAFARLATTQSPAMREALRTLLRLAPTNLTILIEGETGTGKELFSRAVHELSRRRNGPLVRVNCAAVPESLAEAEYFGSMRGAYTGAIRTQPGRFVEADEGTLFLDEVGEMPLFIQGKLLRALQECEVTPLGSGAVVGVDVRVVAATNRRLSEAVDSGSVRSDFYSRLCGVVIRTVPLRERREDIPDLARYFAERFGREQLGCGVHITEEAVRILAMQSLTSGNVRELKGMVERSVALARDPKVVDVEDLQMDPVVTHGSRTALSPTNANIIAIAERHGYRLNAVARELGIGRQRLANWIRRRAELGTYWRIGQGRARRARV